MLSRSTPRGYSTPIYSYCVQWERPQRLHQQFRCDLGHCDAFNGAMVCLQCPGAPQTVHSAAGAACITLLHVPIPVRAPVHIGHTMPVPVLLVYMYMMYNRCTCTLYHGIVVVGCMQRRADLCASASKNRLGEMVTVLLWIISKHVG